MRAASLFAFAAFLFAAAAFADDKPAGQLYRITGKGVVSVHKTGIGITNTLAWSPDSRWVLAMCINTVHLWEIATSKPVGSPIRHGDGEVKSVDFSADGQDEGDHQGGRGDGRDEYGHGTFMAGLIAATARQVPAGRSATWVWLPAPRWCRSRSPAETGARPSRGSSRGSAGWRFMRPRRTSGS